MKDYKVIEEYGNMDIVEIIRIYLEESDSYDRQF